MSRWVATLLFSSLLALPARAQDAPKQPPKPPAQQPQQPEEQEPPEEDANLKPKEYAFNPLEAEHDLKVGLYYYKKGNYAAAMARFREATRWNPSYAEAFLHLGETEEKLKDKAKAHDAYAKYLELAPDAKDAEAVKKKLAGKR
jgi:tetratricopeptide (TPR) repeat protein